MTLKPAICCTALLIGQSLGVATADGASWTFNAPRGEGYSIDLESAEPKPGTPLVRGTEVSFRVSVRYALENARHGTIILVFQDSQDASITVDREQAAMDVTRGSGTLTLADTIVVPRDANELRLFIPLVPEGMPETTGEITIRYPLTTRADGPQYMPYPVADISAVEWEQYHGQVTDTCASSRRVFPGENLEVFECPANSLHLAFTTAGHAAHPAWITRQIRDGVVEQIGYFAGPEEPFATLFQSYLDLTARTLKRLPDRDAANPGGSTATP